MLHAHGPRSPRAGLLSDLLLVSALMRDGVVLLSSTTMLPRRVATFSPRVRIMMLQFSFYSNTTAATIYQFLQRLSHQQQVSKHVVCLLQRPLPAIILARLH